MAASEDDLPTPLARAQPGPAAALLRTSLRMPARKTWAADYGSALRDQLATAVLIRKSGTDAVAVPALTAALPGADLDPKALDTQEQAWVAAAATLGTGTPPILARVDGRDVPRAPLITLPLTSLARVLNTGAALLWASVSVSGVPSVAAPASRNLMQVRRCFFDQGSTAVDPDKLPQNTTFVLLLEGCVENGQSHQAMLRAGLLAGWEVAGWLPAGKVPGMDWLGELTAVNTEVAADDRFAATLDLSDMYRPAIYARQNTVRVSVLPPP